MLTRKHTARVLLVDDDPIFLGRASIALESITELRTTRCGLTALNIVAHWQPHVIVLDLLLDDLDGFTFVEHLREIAPEKEPFVLYTCGGRGADTRVRPLPNWRVGTLMRNSDVHQLRLAVLQAAACQDPIRHQSSIA